MTSEASYYSVLQSAISKTEPDSFEARGAIYDRAWQIVLNQLSNDTASEEEIAGERATFLRAVQRIEFGGGLPPAEDSAPAYEPRQTEPSPLLPLKKPR